MAIPVDFQAFRAPGIYLLEQDRSNVPVITAPQGARILIGNSRIGPVGRPILIQNWTEFKSYFGNISRADERSGDFSKRMAYYMLQAGPIYYLNLRSFDDTLDQAGRIDIALDSGSDNGTVQNVPYRQLFDSNQFWVIDPDSLPNPTNTEQLLTFANAGTRKLSMFVRRSATAGSTLTFEEWYRNLGREMPDFVYPLDQVRDWFVDVFVFANDFSDATANNANANYGYVFDTNGVLKSVTNESGDTIDGLSELQNITEANFVRKFSGCLIPGFIDEAGNNQDIQQLINAEVNTVGLIAAFNNNVFDTAADWQPVLNVDETPNYANNGQKTSIPVDFVGHNTVSTTTDASFDETAYDAESISSASYSIPTVIEEIIQNNEASISVTDLEPVSSNATLQKIRNAYLKGTETAVGSDYSYSVTDGNDTVLYAFEANKPAVNDKYIGRDGNLASVKSVTFVGTKTFLRGFNTQNLPIQPDTATDFTSGNDGFGADIAFTTDSVLLSNGAYGTGAADTTVASVTAPSTIVTAADISGSLSNGAIFKVGNRYFTVASVATTSITVTEDFTSDSPVAADNVYVTDATATANTTSLQVNADGIVRVRNVDTNTTDEITVTNGDLIGFFNGGWSKYSDAAFNYTTYTIFPKNSAGLYVYPVGHPLANQPVVGSTGNSDQPVHNPRTGGTYSYQLNADGSDAIPTYPTTNYNPGAEELINVLSTALSDEQLANVRTSGGYVQNLYEVALDKSILFNATTGGLGSKAAYTSTGARSTKSILTLDNGNEVILYNNDNIAYQVRTLEQAVKSYMPFVLRSYTPRREQFVDGTAARQKEVLDTLTSDFRTPLKNHDLIAFEYLVDGFASYVEPSIKIQLSTIAADRVTCLALANMPTMREFQKSTNPYFAQTIGGRFDPQYIATGGNLQLPYTKTFSLPRTGNTNIAFFGPALVVTDGGQSILMPPAGIASNNFANKFQGGNVYDIVAGPQNGRISGTNVSGVEYSFKPSNITGGGGDLDVLAPFGYNAIVNKRTTGLQIYGNRTAQNTINTSLSSIHVREIIKNIQLQMLQLLENYVFQYNTEENRLEAKTRADGITRPFVSAGALISATNICDTTNNTTDVIAARLFILETVLVANNGVEIAVHKTIVDIENQTASFELL